MAELRRILCSPKRIALLLILAVCNLALFSAFCRTYSAKGPGWETLPAEYRMQLEAEEAAKHQQYLTETYPQYLAYVQAQRGTQSVFGAISAKKDPYVQRSLEKTAAAYSRLAGITLAEGSDDAVNAVREYSVTDYLLLIAPLLLALSLAADADTAADALIRTTKRGRVPVCAVRVLSLLLMSALSVLLLYGGNVLTAALRLGDPVLSRPLQSVQAFQLCAYRVSVGGYFLGTALMKTLAAAVFSLAAWLLLARMQPLLGWGSAFACAGLCFLLHRAIAPTSPMAALKFMNPFAALEADVFYVQYSHLRLFGRPVSFRSAMLGAVLLLLILLTALCLLRIGAARPGRFGSGLQRLGDRFAKRLSKLTPRHTLLGHEGWKLLIAQGGVLVIAAAALLGNSLRQQTQFYYWSDWHGYEQTALLKKYEGPVTDEKLADITAEVEAFNAQILKQEKRIASLREYGGSPKEISDAENALASLQSRAALRQTFADEMQQLSDYTARTGRETWLIDRKGYAFLFYENTQIRRCCMVLLLFLVFAFRALHAYDNRFDTALLLRALRRGRLARRTASWMWVMLLTLTAAAGLHAIVFLQIRSGVGLAMPEAPAQSLPYLQWIPVSVSLKTAMIGHFVLQYFIALLIAGAVVQISRFSRTPHAALLTALAVFLLPAALAESGISSISFLDPVRWLSCTAAG